MYGQSAVLFKNGLLYSVSRGIPRNGIPSEFPPEIPLQFVTEFCKIPRNSVSAEFREIFHGIPRNFSRNSAEFFTEFRGILFSRKISTEFRGIFSRNFAEFLRNCGIPFEKFDGIIIPSEFFLTE